MFCVLLLDVEFNMLLRLFLPPDSLKVIAEI